MTASRTVDQGTPSTGPAPAHGPPGRVPAALAAVVRRWPTALALALATVAFATTPSGERVGDLAEVLLFLPLLYLVVSTLRRPALTWVVLIVGVVGVSGLQALERVEVPVVLLAAALTATVWGGAHGRLGDGSWFTAQVTGMVLFGAVAFVAMAVNPAAGRYLVAAGWLAHGFWDFVHLRRGRVVARSYAEWCGVFDVAVAVQLVVLPQLL